MDWSLDELETQVATALQAAGVGPLNGQIAEVPNARTIRYYTTIGLLDRPRQAGRTALYGRRHLEQVVAIKRLQARGLPLADIQRQLPALSDAELQTLAALPALDVAGEQHGPEPKRESRRDRAFWGSEPADPSPVPSVPVTQATSAVAVTGITLACGVTLTFPSERALSAADLEAIRAALVGVTETLRARGLVTDELAPEKKDEEAP
ncbi:MAG TPA: MerR family transcriptional regulator [Planctomycetota bacterium]|nr:MerR family transcriptional regulator [Planctomycetota bacterium]